MATWAPTAQHRIGANPIGAVEPTAGGYRPDMPAPAQLHALALNCTLTRGPAESSTQLMTDLVLAALGKHGVRGDSIRLVDLDVHPGVEKDMGDGDAWPAVRERMLAADILLVATPTWMGHLSSVAQRVLERLDAELSEADEQGRPLTFGKVGLVAVVGNEDGAHKITADLFQGLNDVGFTVPAQGGVYWNGEAMTKTDFKDLEETPPAVESAVATMAANAAHLATLLARTPYPPST
jgi:multimeric flavodoxin WrbA